MISEECIDIIKDRLISLIDSGKLKATYRPSDSTISFYVNEIDVGRRPLLTLRLSDHRTSYQHYVNSKLTPPSGGGNTNVSIEFYKPKMKDGKKVRNRLNNNINIPQDVSCLVPFVVKSFSYKPELLFKSDIDLIYKAIIAWIFGGDDAEYKDPFAGSEKEANVVFREANIKMAIPLNISVDKNGNYIPANNTSADYVPESRTIRMNESEFKNMVMDITRQVILESQEYACYKPAGLERFGFCDVMWSKNGVYLFRRRDNGEFLFGKEKKHGGYDLMETLLSTGI